MKTFVYFLFIICYFFFSFLRAIEDVPLLSFGVGLHSIFKEKYQTTEFRLEYKFNYEFKRFRPFIGLMTTLKGATYICTGIGLEFIIYKHFILSPNFSLGYYNKGGGKDLGYPLEFRSGAEIGWRFNNCHRIGLFFYHMSNAGLGHRNPGIESLLFFYSIPLGFCATKCRSQK